MPVTRLDAALDERLVLRHFLQSTPLQHSQEPCEWQTRWQMSSPSSRRPIPHGGLSRGYPMADSSSEGNTRAVSSIFRVGRFVQQGVENLVGRCVVVALARP